MKYILVLAVLFSGFAFAETPSYCKTKAGQSQTFMALGFIQSKEDDEPFLEVRQSLFAQCSELEKKKTEPKDLTLQLHKNCRELSTAKFKSKDSRQKYWSACDSAYNAADSYFEGLENGKASCSGNWTKAKGTKVEIDMDAATPKVAPPK